MEPRLTSAQHHPGSDVDAKAVVVGIDFGTLSGRALVVRVTDGAELGSAVQPYRNGVVDRTLPVTGEVLPPDWALQVPDDYRDVLRRAVPEAIRAAGVDPGQVIGIGIDFTACTMVPTTADGTPLCELTDYTDRPHAYPKLWRHHAAQPQAELITRIAAERGEPWLSRYGGTISSEWEFAKALQILQEDPTTYAAIDRWVEAADWIVWQLTGRYTRNACSAGYKGILQEGRYPSPDFLSTLDPKFAGFVADKLEQPIIGLGERAGRLTAQAASWTDLPVGIPVAAGNVDAHVTAAAGNAITPGQLVAIMGTSTCHIVNGSGFFEVPGMCGAVVGGVVSGLWGYEAGQSGVGDIFAWWVDCCVPGSYRQEADRRGIGVHELLSELAEQQSPGEHGLLALDWHSGNRSVLVDHDLSGLLIGQTLATKAEDVYRALIEATAYGSRMIVEAFNRSGVPVEEFVAAGGLVRNRMLMQIYADVLGMPVSIIGSRQGPALGSAIHAAVAAGAYPDVPAAASVMGRLDKSVYVPDPERAARYDELYSEYVQLHDYFGRGQNLVMHRLKDIRRRARKGRAA
jgi:L-ribulokinase